MISLSVHDHLDVSEEMFVFYDYHKTVFMDLIKIVSLALVFFVMSCNKHVSKNAPSNIGLKELYKRDAFASCLRKSYNNSELNEVFSHDRSLSSDFLLGLENYKEIEDLTDIIVDKIETDSLNWTQKVCPGCEMEKDSQDLIQMYRDRRIGKRTLHFCLEFYNSKELDSIATSSTRGL